MKYKKEFVDWNRISSSELYRTYIYDFGILREFYSGNPKKIEDAVIISEEILRRNYERNKLCDVLITQNEEYGAGKATFENIEILRDENSLAVVTGQQTGLFGGPLYTLYKTLTAVKSSILFAEKLNKKCVPVFWMTSEDSDFDEVNHIFALDKENKIQKIAFSHKPSAISHQNMKIPVKDIVLGGDIINVLRILKDSLPETEFSNEVFERLGKCYKKGKVFQVAFAEWMVELTSKYGVILLDPSDERLKRLGISVFKKEIESAPESSNLIVNTAKRLKESGFHAQVELREEGVNLFYCDGERKIIKKKNGEFEIGERRVGRNELLEILEKEPFRFSTNVALTPIYRDAILPDFCYVAGPSEIAYFGEYKKSYEFFGIKMPLVFPRTSVTLVEKKIKNIFEKYNLKFEDFCRRSSDDMVSQVLLREIPLPELEERKNLEKEIENMMSLWRNKIKLWDSSLEEAIRTCFGAISHQLDSLEKKILKVHKRKNEELVLQIEKVKNNVFPLNELQERSLNILYFINKYGFDFIDNLYETMDVENFEHQGVYVE